MIRFCLVSSPMLEDKLRDEAYMRIVKIKSGAVYVEILEVYRK